MRRNICEPTSQEMKVISNSTCSIGKMLDMEQYCTYIIHCLALVIFFSNFLLLLLWDGGTN